MEVKGKHLEFRCGATDVSVDLTEPRTCVEKADAEEDHIEGPEDAPGLLHCFHGLLPVRSTAVSLNRAISWLRQNS